MIPVPDVLTSHQSETLRAWGVDAPPHVRGKYAHDGRFVQVQAPEGWQVVNHAHYMYRALVDARGFRRALFFCKPEFYDRRTEVSRIETAVCASPRPGQSSGRYVARVTLGAKYVLWEDSEEVAFDDVYERALAVMRERWPDFANYGAYWDLPVDGLPLYVEQS